MSEQQFQAEIMDELKQQEYITPLEFFDNWFPDFVKVIYQPRKIDEILGLAEKLVISDELNECLKEIDERNKNGK